MAVAQVHQREIVEVPFTLPDGQILPMFNTEDVIAHHNCFLRQPFFDEVVDRIVGNIMDGDWEE